MIRYSLECNKGHAFDGWFRNSDAFDRQVKRHLVTCPDCGSQKIEKSIMAPNVSTKKSADRGEVAPVAAHARPDGAVTA
ncbi:MAG TPA: DUF1178 family protein, partial [Hyphomicrobiaceae bacterium]|nr:DUF1178 family protein [Hyphomicrobiaceae bacterium]